ncbi:MAG: hypothetical protein ACLFT3_19970 [Cyclobacteriaceae bacterium]
MKTFYSCVPVLLYLWLTAACVSYGPGISGNEYPFVPVPALDTVAHTSTTAFVAGGLPQTYAFNDRNYLVGAGMMQTKTLPTPFPHQSNGWSFVYGGMAYTGRYALKDPPDLVREIARNDSVFQYNGGMVYAAARWHIWSDSKHTFLLEPSISVYMEQGDYFVFRSRFNRDQFLRNTSPVTATLMFSQILQYKINQDWSLTGIFTTALPADLFLLRYNFSGTAGVSYKRSSFWLQPSVHINPGSLLGLTDLSIRGGISYHIF